MLGDPFIGLDRLLKDLLVGVVEMVNWELQRVLLQGGLHDGVFVEVGLVLVIHVEGLVKFYCLQVLVDRLVSP